MYVLICRDLSGNKLNGTIPQNLQMIWTLDVLNERKQVLIYLNGSRFYRVYLTKTDNNLQGAIPEWNPMSLWNLGYFTVQGNPNLRSPNGLLPKCMKPEEHNQALYEGNFQVI